ncbi:DEP domain-containing protein 1A isoform X1 [Paramormyrops kingsleyae]|uniref:DEP domain-containing protein 1A isoform X1 n=1 Tax=Paramormyrops kingsleyae TaxID=1676925 RepID=UPI003B979D60
MNFVDAHIVTPGPYRATKLWNEVTKLFRAGMPLRKHRLHLRFYGNCFTAAAATDWLHDLLRNNCNFGPDVTRHQTLQLLRKFLKNHVIEDVKGRWGSEDLEEDGRLYRFPSTSPVKPVPSASSSTKKRKSTLKEKEALFKFRSSRIFGKESQENVDPLTQEVPADSSPREEVHRRELTEDDILDIWRTITLTHLQKTLGLSSLEDVLNPFEVNSCYIAYNMTNVNKHGVVTLEDKTDDLPHWVLSAMKCLANWPKYDLNQPSYPGFERDVFKTVSDYFVNLPQPLLTYEYYELFVNVLVLCGYIVLPKNRHGKRKNLEDASCPQPPKTPHLNGTRAFRSTECLLLSLIRKEAIDETESPMREVFSSRLMSRPPSLGLDPVAWTHQQGISCRDSGGHSADLVGGCCLQRESRGAAAGRLRPRSSSLEGIIDHKTDGCSQLKCKSMKNLPFRRSISSGSGFFYISPWHEEEALGQSCLGRAASASSLSWDVGCSRRDANVHRAQLPSSSGMTSAPLPAAQPRRNRSRSFCNLPDMVNHRSASSFSINTPVAEITMKPDCSSSIGLRRPSLLKLTSSLAGVQAVPDVSRRCCSSMDLSNKCAAPVQSVSTITQRPSPEQSLLQPQLEQVAIEALQLCTLLIPPVRRRKLQLLMRMISRMSQNVDMPRLHSALGTRTLMVHTFSRCVLCCEEEMDLDELLATRLVSFLLDHHQEILQVPVYLQNAVQDHIAYLRKVQVTYPGADAASALPTYSFCRQISAQEFEEQKLTISQTAIAELLESLIKNKTMAVKEKKKKLAQFRKEYPDIYSCRFPSTESEAQLFADKPKIKPPMLLHIKKTKAFSVHN